MTRATGPIDSDEDGNAVPLPPAESDLAQLIQLLEYGRRRGFRIGPAVRIGKLAVQVQDLRQTEGTMRDMDMELNPLEAIDAQERGG